MFGRFNVKVFKVEISNTWTIVKVEKEHVWAIVKVEIGNTLTIAKMQLLVRAFRALLVDTSQCQLMREKLIIISFPPPCKVMAFHFGVVLGSCLTRATKGFRRGRTSGCPNTGHCTDIDRSHFKVLTRLAPFSLLLCMGSSSGEA